MITNVYQTLEKAISERYTRNGIPQYTIKTISSGDNPIFNIYNSLSNIYNDEIKCDEYGSEKNARTFKHWDLEDNARLIIELSHTAIYTLHQLDIDNNILQRAASKISTSLPSYVNGDWLLSPEDDNDGFKHTNLFWRSDY